MSVWSSHPNIEILGNHEADRLSIVSFTLRAPSGRYLHHNAVVALLNDLFGIQARGGCSCAGPYGHDLLGVGIEQSREFEREVARGCEGIKPGWTRINFNYFISETVFRYIVEAVQLIATHGWHLLDQYRFDTTLGLWEHRSGVEDVLLRLTDLTYDDDGALRYPQHDDRADESVLAAHLLQSETILRDAASQADTDGTNDDPSDFVAAGLATAEFEALRWFELPSACLVTLRD